MVLADDCDIQQLTEFRSELRHHWGTASLYEFCVSRGGSEAIGAIAAILERLGFRAFVITKRNLLATIAPGAH